MLFPLSSIILAAYVITVQCEQLSTPKHSQEGDLTRLHARDIDVIRRDLKLSSPLTLRSSPNGNPTAYGYKKPGVERRISSGEVRTRKGLVAIAKPGQKIVLPMNGLTKEVGTAISFWGKFFH